MEIPSHELIALDSFTVEEDGLYELHAEVEWTEGYGYRFFHTKHDPVPPCISELIEANILFLLSNMQQKMTGHATLESGTVVNLEVWSSIPTSVEKKLFEVFKVL
jgi:hypothetical protein